jgi:ribonuclease E
MDKNKMLIDATHPEETRVVVLRHGRVEEFDYESASRKLLRGNIYLAKVTRVEPSLQAAFVDYGGNRHGFLAFNEIHPDYYQIPVADRQALLEEEAEADARADEEADAAAHERARRRPDNDSSDAPGFEPQPYIEDVGSAPSEDPYTGELPFQDAAPAQRSIPLEASGLDIESRSEPRSGSELADAINEANAGPTADAEGGGLTEVNTTDTEQVEQVEQVGTEDVMEEVPERPRRRARSYKIQEVIKRRQIILVQVVKEERGNKGAALTTYLSLAGRYTVLMPNTGRGGGISRKITQAQDRKRLKAIAGELEVPEGMGLIIRTAGAARTKQEIKRDYEYLLRLWESVRDMTLQSTAPCLVYEEGNLIKRSIRDLYSKDIDEIVVAGDSAHHEAHDFIRMLQPGGAKSVVHYQDSEPLFARYQIERQLNAMFSPHVTLRSGGYLVINQTEALVAIDVNSGKSTREFSIEETALNTNLEAAEEIARQLKLRDLAGLIVIDFIDMEERRNNRKVEGRMKDALRHDRARIQVGRISHFGLLEMSRQRLRTGVLEGSTSQCPHCQGTGIIRSTESMALAVLRGIEDELMKGRPSSMTALTTAAVALYILNHKRGFIVEIEQRYGITVNIEASERMQGANFAIERAADGAAPAKRPERGAVNMEWGFEGEDREPAEAPRESRGDREPRQDRGEDDAESDSRRDGPRRRRRRGRGGDRGGDRGDRPFSADRPRGHDQPSGDRPANGSDAHDHADSANGAGHDDAHPERSDAEGDEDRGGETPRGAEGRNGEERRSRRGRRRGRRGGRNRERREAGDQGEHASASGDFASAEGGSSEWRSPESRDAPADDDRHEEPASAHTGETHEPQAEREPAATSYATDYATERVGSVNDVRETRREESVAVPARPEPVREERSVPAYQAPEPERSPEPDKATAEDAAQKSDEPVRKGWWQKRFGSA